MKLLYRSGLLFGFLFGLALAMPRARAETIASRTIDERPTEVLKALETFL